MRFVVVLVVLGPLLGCIPEKKSKTGSDTAAPADTSTPDLAGDTAAPADTSTPDLAGDTVAPADTSTPDLAGDTTAPVDTATPDLKLDVLPDAPEDSTVMADALLDSGPDSSTTDTTPEVVSADTPSETTPTDIEPGDECEDDNDTPWDGCTNGNISEFRINTHTDQDQRRPSLAILENGSFVVVWESCPVDWDGGAELPSQDLTGCGVYARVYQGNGAPAGDELQLNIMEVEYDQWYPHVVAVKGGFAVSWISYVEGQGFDPVVKLFWDQNSPVADAIRLVDSHSTAHGRSRVSVLDDLTFLMTWIGYDEPLDQYQVYARQYSHQGDYDFFSAGNQVLSPDVPQGEDTPSIWRANNDHFIVLYDVSDLAGSILNAQLFLPDGSLLGDAHTVNQAPYDGMLPATARTWGNAGTFVTARYHSNDEGGYDIAIRRHETDGAPVGIDYAVKPDDGSSIRYPHMDVFPGGEDGPQRMALAWQVEGTSGFPDPEDVFVNRYEINPTTGKPTALGPDERCNIYSPGSQAKPEVGVFPNGRYVVVWESCPFNFDPDQTVGDGQDEPGCGVFAQLFDENGEKVAPATPQ